MFFFYLLLTKLVLLEYTSTTELSRGGYTVKPTNYCFVIIHHTGNYVAKFSVTWEIIMYDEADNVTLTHYDWKGNDHHRTTGYYTIIPIPDYAKNLTLNIKNATDLTSYAWHTIINKVDLPLKPTIKVKTWGMASDPQYSIAFEK